MLPDLAGAYGGAYRRITLRPTPGLLNCADHPAAVSSSGVFATETFMNTAASAVCKMLACGDAATRELILGAPTPNLASLIAAGIDGAGQEFMLIDANGLMGSLAGRASRDGVDSGGHWWIPDGTAQNSEDVEAQTPFLVLARELLPVGADGAGRFRAGVGFRETLLAREVPGAAMVVYQNESFPRGEGLFGGNPGSLARCRVKHGSDAAAQFANGGLPTRLDELAGVEPRITFKGPPHPFASGDVIEWVSPGAAGYGDPLRRDPVQVLADVEARMIDAPAAERIYGVQILDREGTLTVDVAGSERVRRERRQARLGGQEPGHPVDPPHGARRVGELLHVVGGRWWCSGADLGPVTDSYRQRAVTYETPVRELGPEYAAADEEMADRFVLREFVCPITGFRIDAELAQTTEPPLRDIVLHPAG